MVRQIRDAWMLPILEEIIPQQAFKTFKASTNGKYWVAAVTQGLAGEDAILAAVAKRTAVRIADRLIVSSQARDKVSELLARRYEILPLAVTDTTVDIATSNPYDLDCERTLAFALGKSVRMFLASPTKIAERLDEVYRPTDRVLQILERVQHRYDVESGDVESAEDVDAADLSADERPVIKLVDHIIAEGIVARASDIHLEAEEGGIAVRYRIDGILREMMVLPRAVGVPIVSRIKIMAKMDIADRLRPQGGRARVVVNGARVDLRVSTLPAAQGEKVVIRVLDSRSTTLSLDALGLSEGDDRKVRRLLESREGLILVTGPTGSGKTTTLYAALQQLKSRGSNIITVEDPVEYRIPGIVQVQVNEKAGLTFAAALRSILRQDPDVVLIGEIRDAETASIALQASLTGHLVFATLHTIDACSSITRLMDLGVETVKVATALRGVIAQRLIRKLCKDCADVSDEPVPQQLWNVVPTGARLPAAVGCSNCSMTGYYGRMAVMEVVVSTPELERAIAGGCTPGDLVRIGRVSGAKSLWDSGVDQLLSGATTAEEILRVAEPEFGRDREPVDEFASEAVQSNPNSSFTADGASLQRLRLLLKESLAILEG